MDTLAIFGLQLVLSLIVYTLMAKWYCGAMAGRKTDPLGIDCADLSPRISAYWVSVFGLRPGCPTFAELFCLSGCLWGSCQRPARITVSASSSKRLGPGAAIGLAVQHCRHGGPSKCTAPSGCCTTFGDDLVHPDICGAPAPGNSCHDFCPAAQTRTLKNGSLKIY